MEKNTSHFPFKDTSRNFNSALLHFIIAIFKLIYCTRISLIYILHLESSNLLTLDSVNSSYENRMLLFCLI